MSANIKSIPADEWITDYCSDELKADRKADKPRRVVACNFSEAFTALMHAGGVNPSVHQALNVFLGKSRGLAPHEEIAFFSEKEAGALLPGDEGVTDGSLRKRWVRAWEAIEAEQADKQKLFAGSRVKGSLRLASKTTDEKKVAPKYYSEIAQAVVDVERLAGKKRGSRSKRFSEAAIEIWNKLPAYVAPDEDTTIKLKAVPEPRGERLSGNRRNAARRLDEAMKACFEETSDVDTLEAAMIEKVREMARVARGVVNSLPSDNTRVDKTENGADPKTGVRGTNFFESSQNTEQNREDDAPHVDSAVHVDGCVACGVEMSDEEVKINTELCCLCRPPDRMPGELPTAFRLIQEMDALPDSLPALAIWRNAEHDMPVTGELGQDASGRRYVSILESSAGVPLDEIAFETELPHDLTYEPEIESVEYEEGVM
jgi:hypothetical protein